MINRINLILRAKNITARQFAEEIGIQPSGMSHILGGRNNPSLEFVNKLLRRYPEIDANWLLLGKGEMYGTHSLSSAAPQNETPAEVPVPDAPVPADVPTEPSLFDEEPAGSLRVEESSHRPLYQQEAIEEEERRYVPSYIATPPEPPADREVRVDRILLIYRDNTFKEVLPRP